MLKLGNLNISKVYIGSTPAPKGFLGEAQIWGQSTPVETIVPDFVVTYYPKSVGELLSVVANNDNNIDKVGRYNAATGLYEVVELEAGSLHVTVEENEPFKYGFTLNDKTVLSVSDFDFFDYDGDSNNYNIREFDAHTLTSLRELKGYAAYLSPIDTTILLPNTVQRFKEGCCVGLTVKVWDNGAYRYGLPNGVTYIDGGDGESTWEGCFAWSKLWDEENEYEFTIPASVTHLGVGAFFGAKLPSDLRINSTVNIPNNCFDSVSFGTNSSASIYIAEGNTSIGNSAFYLNGQTFGISNLSLPSTLKTIGEGAFSYDQFLLSEDSYPDGLVLPDGLTTIGGGAFNGCYNAAVSESLKVVIPSSVTTIGGGAFYDAEIGEIHINGTTPATLRNDYDAWEGSYPFDNCHTREQDPETFERKPTPLYVPCEAVDAYKTAWSMYEDRISCQRNIINPNFDVYYQKQEGDENDWQIFNPALINLIDKIGVYNDDGECEEYDIPADGKLPYATFAGLPVNRMGFILKTPTALDTSLFDSTDAHEIDGIVTTAPWTRVYNSLNSAVQTSSNECLINLPDTVQRIEDWACARMIVSLPDGTGGFEMSRLPNACTYIGDYAFKGCHLSWGDEATPYEIPARITHIGRSAFESAWLSHDINYNTTVGVPDEFMFQVPIYINNVNIAEGNTSIGTGAFHSVAIKDFSLPSTLRTIGDDAFYGVRMQDGEGNDGSGITIPASVTSIGSYAFQNAGIPAIYFEGATPPTIGDDVFTDCMTPDNTPTPIYVPCEAVDAYKTAWAAWADRITCDSPAPYGYKAKLTLSNGTEVEIPKTATTDVTITNADFDYDNIASAVIYSGVTTIGNDAFGGSSISAITLPNTLTTITDGAFLVCFKLSSITLPNSVTTIGENAFQLCTSLASVTLPNSVTTIGENAFQGCTSLASVTLPTGLTEIDERAFDLCFSLTSAIVIPSGVTSIGVNAFWDCPLASVTVEGTTPAALSEGAFGSSKTYPIYVPCASIDAYKAAEGWSNYADKIQCVPEPDPSEEYFHFISLADGSMVKANSKFQYSLDGGNTWTAGDNAMKTLNSGATIHFKGTNSAALGANAFALNAGTVEVRGNIMSLVYGDSFKQYSVIPADNFFNGLLRDSTSLTKADKLVLPATAMTTGAYAVMFSNCRSLIAAPVLPATTLAESCYAQMFNSCTSLRQAPELPATTLKTFCYHLMFEGCTSLTSAPVLPATTLSFGGYWSMFSDCTSLTSAPVLPATNLNGQCYQEMFAGCTSLTSAPALPATNLREYYDDSCYEGMFSGCTSLRDAPALPATTLSQDCYMDMFKGCTSLQTAPDLPATTLVSNCYNEMFKGCTNLNYVKAMFTTTPSATYIDSWVNGVFPAGTFVKNSAATWDNSLLGLPNAWTVQTADA